MNTWYRISLYCGLIPLCLGIAIYLGWIMTGAHWLEVAGLFNIVVGLCLFSIGVISLGIYIYKAHKMNVGGYLFRSMIPLFILVINFPVANEIINSINFIKSTSIVKIENHSRMSIVDFRLTEQDEVYIIGAIPSAGKVEQEFHFKYEGSVYYSFNLNEKKYKGVMFGYVSPGFSSNSTMVISETGEVSVEEILNGNGEL